MQAIALFLAWSAILLTLNGAEPVTQPTFQMRLVQDKPAADSEPMSFVHSDRSDAEVLNVAKVPALDSSDVKSAKLQKNSVTGQPEVGIVFTDHGRKAFADLTRTNINKRLAIVIGGKIVSAPIIRTEIPDGKATIAGNFSEADAKDLVARINQAARDGQSNKMKPWTHGPYDALTR
jgi:preprotein translocase subunit SecD